MFSAEIFVYLRGYALAKTAPRRDDVFSCLSQCFPVPYMVQARASSQAFRTRNRTGSACATSVPTHRSQTPQNMVEAGWLPEGRVRIAGTDGRGIQPRS